MGTRSGPEDFGGEKLRGTINSSGSAICSILIEKKTKIAKAPKMIPKDGLFSGMLLWWFWNHFGVLWGHFVNL